MIKTSVLACAVLALTAGCATSPDKNSQEASFYGIGPTVELELPRLDQYTDSTSDSYVHHYFVAGDASGLAFRIERVERSYKHDSVLRKAVEEMKKSPENRYDSEKKNSLIYENYYTSNVKIHVAVNVSTGVAAEKPDVAYGIDKWVDIWGYIHTLKVLEAQLELNAFMARMWNAAEKEPLFSLVKSSMEEGPTRSPRVWGMYASFFQGEAFALPLPAPALIHGKMDRKTFMIPYWKLVTRLHILKTQVLARCLAQDQLSWCDASNPASPYLEVRENIRTATERLRGYADAANGIPLYQPTVIAPFTRNSALDGLANVPTPAMNETMRRLYQRNQTVTFTRSGDEPELKVRETVDATAIEPELIRQLREWDRVCSAEVAAAELALKR